MKKIIFLVVAIHFLPSLSKGQTNQKDFPVLKEPYFGQKPPNNIPELFAPGVLVKEKQAHSTVIFSKKGTEAYWCHNGIWFSKFENGKWTVPEMPPFSKKEYSDDAPFLSPDGKYLFFASKRPVQVSDTSRKENIWQVEIKNGSWSEARPLPSIVNKVFQHWQVSVDNGGTIYFSHRANGDINSDNNIYCAKFINGEYQMPEKLGQMINSGDSEGNPFISPEGDYLIFSRVRDRKPLDGGLFISFKQNDGSWSESIALQKYVNFKYGGNCPFVSQDGKYLFFLDIYEGKYQRYWVSAGFIEKLSPKQ